MRLTYKKPIIFLYIVLLVSLLISGCQNTSVGDTGTDLKEPSHEATDLSDLGLTTSQDYQEAIETAIEAEDAQKVGQIFTAYGAASGMTSEDDDAFTSAVSVALDTKVQDMLMNDRGAEARDFVVALREAHKGLISDMYFDYATAPPDDPEVILGRDAEGNAFARIRSITYVYYSFDGENYSPYEEESQLDLKGHDVLYTYARNPFDNVSKVVEVSLEADSPAQALGDWLMDQEVDVTEALTFYMEGMSRARFYLEATDPASTLDPISDIIVDKTETGYRGITQIGKRHMTVDFTIDDSSDDSDQAGETARSLMAYYQANDLYTTMLNYGLRADRVFEVTDSAIMTAILQAVSSDDTVITQIDPSKTSKMTLGLLQNDGEMFFLIKTDEGPTVYMDTSFQLIDQSNAESLDRRFLQIIGD